MNGLKEANAAVRDRWLEQANIRLQRTSPWTGRGFCNFF